MRRIAIAVLLSLCTAPTMIGQVSTNPLIGVWRAAGREGAGGMMLTNIPPAMRMFTAKHYSWIASPIERPAVPFDKATDTQKTDLWNFVAEMGTYEIKGSNVVTLVMVGRDPGRTTSAYSEEFTFKIEGNRLLLNETPWLMNSAAIDVQMGKKIAESSAAAPGAHPPVFPRRKRA